MSKLEAIAAKLDGQARGDAAAGTSHGVRILFELATRGVASSTESWTHVTAEIPPAYPLVIHMRRQSGGHEIDVRRGLMIDIQVGDAAFDDKFTIEAAPADVVRQLLDDEARRYLARWSICELDTIDETDRRLLRFAVPGWIEETSAALEAIEMVARIASRVREAFAAADAAHPASEQGGPYRTELDDRPRRDATTAREAEVATLRAVRAARSHRDLLIVIAMLAAVALFFIIAMLGIGRCHGDYDAPSSSLPSVPQISWTSSMT